MLLLQDPAQFSFWQIIKPYDVWLLTKINQDLSNPFLDTIFPLFRETIFWLPLYLFLFVFIRMNFGIKGYWWILGVILTAALSDVISSQVIKELIFRLRPCQDEQVAPLIRFIINYCPRSSGFTSSHATTHFAQAMFFYLTLRHLSKWMRWVFLWAFLISYAQIYVGVHYPSDVFCGAIIGCIIGWLISKLFSKHIGMLSLD